MFNFRQILPFNNYHPASVDNSQYLASDIYIDHPTAQYLNSKLQYLHDVSFNDVSKMRCLRVIGETQTGKTSALKHFCQTYKPIGIGQVIIEPTTNSNLIDFKPMYNDIPEILMLTASPLPRVSSFWIHILNEIGAPVQSRATVDKLLILFQQILYQSRVRMLILDEINYLAEYSPKDQIQIMNSLKNISDKLKMPIVLSGTPSSMHCFEHDQQLSERYEKFHISKYPNSTEFEEIILGFIKMHPCRDNFFDEIIDQQGLNLMYVITDGYIGKIRNLMVDINNYCQYTNQPRPTMQTLETIYDQRAR